MTNCAYFRILPLGSGTNLLGGVVTALGRPLLHRRQLLLGDRKAAGLRPWFKGFKYHPCPYPDAPNKVVRVHICPTPCAQTLKKMRYMLQTMFRCCHVPENQLLGSQERSRCAQHPEDLQDDRGCLRARNIASHEYVCILMVCTGRTGGLEGKHLLQDSSDCRLSSSGAMKWLKKFR